MFKYIWMSKYIRDFSSISNEYSNISKLHPFPTQLYQTFLLMTWFDRQRSILSLIKTKKSSFKNIRYWKSSKQCRMNIRMYSWQLQVNEWISECIRCRVWVRIFPNMKIFDGNYSNIRMYSNIRYALFSNQDWGLNYF